MKTRLNILLISILNQNKTSSSTLNQCKKQQKRLTLRLSLLQEALKLEALERAQRNKYQALYKNLQTKYHVYKKIMKDGESYYPKLAKDCKKNSEKKNFRPKRHKKNTCTYRDS